MLRLELLPKWSGLICLLSSSQPMQAYIRDAHRNSRLRASEGAESRRPRSALPPPSPLRALAHGVRIAPREPARGRESGQKRPRDRHGCTIDMTIFAPAEPAVLVLGLAGRVRGSAQAVSLTSLATMDPRWPHSGRQTCAALASVPLVNTVWLARNVS
ncbi:hypothetical protein C8Q80DRAFT_757863 [Daedaleopsis nitida]|nr:hypothetical protein C8Q80DRAFT_757863 [Daedaleopsis nitida]